MSFSPVHVRRIFSASVAALALGGTAAAQRADDNAVRSAEDAFGTTIGNEDIGLYNPNEARGFSAIDAGNARIDGLYFDQQIDPVSHLISAATIRIGISAQSYPLPAPTGIVDYALIRAGDKPVRSLLASAGPFGSLGIEADLQLPLQRDRLSLVAGGTLNKTDDGYSAASGYANIAVMPRWTPSDRFELIVFGSTSWSWAGETQPAIYVAGDYLPPRIKRDRFYGQSWADNRNVGANFGALARLDLGRTTVRFGAFRSLFSIDRNYADLFLDTLPDGTANRVMVQERDTRFASMSGELRLTHDFGADRAPQRVHLVVRARDQHRRYGGAALVDLGVARIGIPDPQPEPVIAFGPKTRDHVRQLTGALAYEGRLFGRLELSAGLQKAFYRKETIAPDDPVPVEGRDSPWLANVAGAMRVVGGLAVYGSYTQGLEEGGVAPNNAVNRNAASPALRTRQVDAGLRYAFSDNLRLVAGVFDVRKPYFNIDPDGVYRRLGDFRQRGIEMSLTGSPVQGLYLVAGTLFLDPRVTGEEVRAGIIGRKPVGQTSRLTIVSGEYELPWAKAFSVGATVTSVGARMASADNRLSIPARSVLDLSARYRFKLAGAPASIVARLGNLFNNFGWRTNASAVFVPNGQRRLSVSMAADF
ncbi:TonB-dependent receptor domain-containing protein [Sphingomonas colocasiae]|uniref:TonB-dependent receptor n=1 Tax=Sphingomonas colocasiae TaxID=1848973 RepID=A0ABS7PM88_9SPHN|nr:TonB-dependent receptor [Sphingomonas colocasiae]MBY8821174.1 TonB-dependent receptor [Sphingomonas colocasiae]